MLVAHALTSPLISCHSKFPTHPEQVTLPGPYRPQLLAEARCKALTLSASSEIGPIQTSAAFLHPLFFFPLNTLIHTASMRPEPDAIQDSCKSDEKSLLHSCSVVKLESKERTRASFQPLYASNIYKPVELASFGLTIIIQITPLDYKRQDFTLSLAIVRHPASGRTQGGRHQKKNPPEKRKVLISQYQLGQLLCVPITKPHLLGFQHQGCIRRLLV